MKQLLSFFTFLLITATVSGQVVLSTDISAERYPYSAGQHTLVEGCDKNITFSLYNPTSENKTRACKLFITDLSGNEVGVVFEEVLYFDPYETIAFSRSTTTSLGEQVFTGPENYLLDFRADATSDLNAITLLSPQYGCSSGSCNPQQIEIIPNNDNCGYPLPTYSISGHVIDSNGNGVSDVDINASNGGGSVFSESNGYYSFTVDEGWSGTVAPSKTGCTFNPNSVNISPISSDETYNFTAECPTLTIDPTISNPTSSSGAGSITVTSNVDWSATSDQAWLTITSGSNGNNNGTIDYSYTENTNVESRTATITVSGASVSDQIFTLNQEAAGASLTIVPTSDNVASSSGSGAITVTSNVDWSATSDQAWLTITSGSNGNNNGTIDYSYTENTNVESRTATITVSGASVSDQLFTLNQEAAGASLTIDPTNDNVASSSGSGAITVTSNVDWSATSDQAWLTITSGSNGNNNGTIDYSYTENTNVESRTATITVSGASVSDQLFTLNQEAAGASLTIDPTNDNVASSSGSGAITVTSNVDWSATSDQAWLTITSGSNGNNNGTINYSYTENTNVESRTATITVSGASVSDQLFTLNQEAAGASLTIDPTNDNVASSSGSGAITVTSNVDWSATSDQAWLTITSGSNGNNNGTIDYSYTENTNVESRTASITVTGTNVNDRNFTLSQDGSTGPTFDPCPDTGEYCNCNATDEGFNLQIQNFYEEMEIGTDYNSVICSRPNYGSNIPVSTSIIWSEVVGATKYKLEIARADGSLITDFPYEEGTFTIASSGYEEHREGELIIRKLTQNLDFETEYQIKITALDDENSILGCATHSFTTYQETQQNAGCVAEKQALAHFNNVIAFCNDLDANECNSYTDSSPDCSHYQCTNYVNRYYASVFNVDLGNARLSGQQRARDYINTNLSFFDYSTDHNNSSSVFPLKPGDIIVFSHSHVAICKSFDSNASTLEIIQQNSSNSEDGGNATKPINVSDITGGWMRLKTLNIDLRETASNQIPLTTDYNQIVDVSNSTPTFQWTHIPDATYHLYIKRKGDTNVCFEQVDGLPFPIVVSASSGNNTGFSLGNAGLNLEQGEYLCRLIAIIDNNVGEIRSQRFYFNINSDNSTVLPVISANNMTITARTENKNAGAPNVSINRKNNDGWELIGTTDKTGSLFSEIYPPLEVGEQIRAQSDGYVTESVTINEENIQNGAVNIYLEEDVSSNFIRNPRMIISEYAPIITQNPVNIQVDAENYTNFDIIKIEGEEEIILYSGTHESNTATYTFDSDGLYNIIVRFSNDNHSVEINQYVFYQTSVSSDNSYDVTVISDENSLGANVYINNEFVKTISSENEVFSVPAETNSFNFTKEGYFTYFETTTGETTINLELGATNVNLPYPADKIRIYPNPATEIITIKTDELKNTKVKITLMDFMGRSVKTLQINTAPDNKIDFETNNVGNGIYFLNIMIDNKVSVTKKVIILKN